MIQTIKIAAHKMASIEKPVENGLTNPAASASIMLGLSKNAGTTKVQKAKVKTAPKKPTSPLNTDPDINAPKLTD